MTIEFFTGFEGISTSEELLTLFDIVGSYQPVLSATGGYNNGKSLYLDGMYDYIKKKTVPSATKTVGFHIRGTGIVLWDAWGGYYYELSILVIDGPNIRISNSENSIVVDIGVTRDYYGNITYTNRYTSERPISHTINHVEVKIYSHITDGTIEIRVNGEPVLNETNVPFNGNPITAFSWGSGKYPGYTPDRRIDNIYIADDFQGELNSLIINPIADDSVMFAPSTGLSNYAMIDDSVQDADATYVYSSALNDKDTYEYSKIPDDLVVKAITMVNVSKKTDVGHRALGHLMKYDSTEYILGQDYLTTEYPAQIFSGQYVTIDHLPDVEETELTPEVINNSKYGFKVTV